MLTTQVQDNANRFLALEDENMTLRQENHNLLKRLSTIETTPQQPPNQWFHVPVLQMQPLVTPKIGDSSSQPPQFQPTAVANSTPFITSSVIDMALSHAMLAGLNVLHVVTNLVLQSIIPPTYMLVSRHDVRAPVYTTLPVMYGPIY